MTTLRIPPEQPWQEASHGHPTRTVSQTVRTGWVWGQRALLALAFILLITLGLLPRLGLYRPVTVLSGSMRPTFSPGDMVIVTPEPVSSVRVGQVISYQVPVGIHQVETHRIVRILAGGAHPTVQTQGDANNWPDPWTAKLEGNTAWRMRTVIPHLGYVVNWLRSPTLQRAAIFLAPALLALLILSEIWGFGDGKQDRTTDTDRKPGKLSPTPMPLPAGCDPNSHAA
jgi:signal peptidase I